jgi:hypothetical protein
LTAVKLTVPILLILTGSAAAEGVTLSAVPASSAPHVVGSEAVCKDTGDRLRITKTKLEGHEVEVLRTCAQASTRIAFQTKDGWTEYDAGAGTTGRHESTTFEKIGKRRFLVHRVDTYVSNESATSRFDLCAYDKSGAPQCGAVEVECPETGCQEPAILKGALWLHAKGGRKKFPIK